VLRLSPKAVKEIGTRIVLDRRNMTIRSAGLDDRFVLNLNAKTRATTFKLPLDFAPEQVLGSYILKPVDEYYQLIPQDEDLEEAT
jgi:hypothetical protein